jgi:hypothetical protein
MSTDGLSGVEPPSVDAGLAHAPDPSTPGVVTVYNPQADGNALASQWLTVEEKSLYDLSDWR